MLGFKRHLEEKLKASDDMGDWVKDFQDSDAPQFKGKSQKKRQQMAVAAKLSAERNEEVELDEVKHYLVGITGNNLTGHTSNPHFSSYEDAMSYKKKFKHVTAINKAKIVKGTSDKHGFVTPVNEEVALDEVSDKKLDAYRQKAFADQPSGDDGSDKYRKRKFGRDLAFAKQTGRAKVLATKESVEELDELNKSTLGSYIKRAAGERGHAGIEAGASASGSKDQKDAMSTMKKRLKGIKMATDKLTKESVEELELAKRVHSRGAEIHDIFHKGKFVGSIGKHFPRNGRPEGYHVLQYTSGRVPKGARGAHRHERINSHDDAKKLVAKHFNEEVELDEASDLRVTKVYNKFPKKAVYAVHSPDRKYYKEFDTEADAKKHLETKK